MKLARRLLPWLVFLLIFAVGCGDDEVNSNTVTDPDLRDGAPSISDTLFLVPNGPVDVQANLTEAHKVGVLAFSKKTGEAVSGEKINFEITDSTIDDASLAARTATTTESGEGAVDVRVGGTSGSLTVVASHPSANSVTFNIEVTPLKVGSLKVNLTNTAPSIMDLYEIDVRLYKASEMTCDEFRPFFAQQDPLMLQRAETVSQAPVFENLGERNTYILTGLAKGDNGQVAGAACQDNINIQADVVNEADLLLQLIPLSPVGTYDVTSNWDFTDALADSGAVGATIVRVLDIFENPGQAIYDEVINLVEALVGGIISGALDTFLSITGLDDSFANMINNFIEGNSVLSKIFQAGRDVRDVVANLEVQSEMTIGKIDSSYEFRATDNWLGVTLYWRWNCDANSPPDCGAIDLAVDSNGEIGSLGVLSSEWDGRVVAYNQLQIDTHTLSLRYGRLIIYILNDILLPELTNGNANSLTEAFAYWIGCPDLATNITGSDGEICALSACVTDDQIESFCDNAISTIFGFANLALESLEFDVGLRLGGEGKLLELDSDGFVDRIEEGEFRGVIENSENGMASSPFTATFEATRRNFDTGNL